MSQMKHSWDHTSHCCPTKPLHWPRREMETSDPCLTSVLPAALGGSAGWELCPAPAHTDLTGTEHVHTARGQSNPGRWAFSSSIFRSKPLPNTSMFSSVHQSTKLDKRGLKGNQGFEPPPNQFSIMGMPDTGWQLVCGKKSSSLGPP